MKPIHLDFKSPDGIEASLSIDGEKGKHDYCARVTVKGLIQNKMVYGIDPTQALYLGMQLIESVTGDRRIGTDDEDPMPGELWTIEVRD